MHRRWWFCIHAGPTQVSLATLAGWVLGGFILGVIVTVIASLAIARNRCVCSGVHDGEFVDPPVKGTAVANMTISDAYDTVEMPAQPHDYEYVTHPNHDDGYLRPSC